MDIALTKNRARGHWRSVLLSIGIDGKYLDGGHRPCPFCGGKDRFRFTDHNQDGMFWCNSCGTGDGIKLVEKFLKLSTIDAVQRIAALLGERPPVAVVKKRETDTGSMSSLWSSGSCLTEGSLVGRYLSARVDRIPQSLEIREKGRMMLSRVSDANGKGVNLHRTIVPTEPWEPGVKVDRLLMRGSLPDGATVKIWPADEVMGIAEGVETAISAARLWKIPVWAALNAQNLAKWTPPAGTKAVFIFGDNDRSYTGQAAAYALAHRLAKLDGIGIKVEIPEEPGTDWNDIFFAKMKIAS